MVDTPHTPILGVSGTGDACADDRKVRYFNEPIKVVWELKVPWDRTALG